MDKFKIILSKNPEAKFLDGMRLYVITHHGAISKHFVSCIGAQT